MAKKRIPCQAQSILQNFQVSKPNKKTKMNNINRTEAPLEHHDPREGLEAIAMRTIRKAFADWGWETAVAVPGGALDRSGLYRKVAGKALTPEDVFDLAWAAEWMWDLRLTHCVLAVLEELKKNPESNS